jgi:hypothetical protein
VELGRFLTILEAYGAASERWPEAEREAASALARASVPAARALAEARLVDEALEGSSLFGAALEPHRFAALQARIVGDVHPLTQSWMGRWFGFRLTPMQLWPSVAGLAMATVLGFAVGLGGMLQAEPMGDLEEGLVFSSMDLPVGGQ